VPDLLKGENNVVTIEKQIRQDTPQVSVPPYKQIHAHSTGNPSSTAQNEADYMNRKDLSSGFFTHVVGNGRIIQTARTNRGAWDVGGSWNNKTYAAVELIESHKTQAEFDCDYKIYVNLLRSLANEGRITLKVDAGPKGINTHYYCTYNQPGNKSDHIDPYPYLQKWGISKAQFKKDVENGSVTPSKPSPSIPAPSQPTYAVKAWNKRQIVDIDVLNVRTTATSKSGLVRQLKKGETFNATRIITNGEQVGQYKSWFEADGWGWVSGAYVTEIKASAPKLKGSDLPNSGRYTFKANTNIRSNASTGSSVVGLYSKGQSVNYDSKVTAGGYVWLSYVGASGNRRYVAVV